MAAATLLVRSTSLAYVLGIPFLLAMLLTLLQLATGNDTLALLFPWRISVILVPLATAVVLARLVWRMTPWLTRQSPRGQTVVIAACVLALTTCVVGGLAILFFRLGYHSNDDELPLLAHVKQYQRRGEVYLLPVDLPNLASPQGRPLRPISPPRPEAARAATSSPSICSAFASLPVPPSTWTSRPSPTRTWRCWNGIGAFCGAAPCTPTGRSREWRPGCARGDLARGGDGGTRDAGGDAEGGWRSGGGLSHLSGGRLMPLAA